MKYLKAFIAGIACPSTLLPFLLCLAVLADKPQVLSIPFLHFIPIIWGIWNVLYIAFAKDTFPKDEIASMLATGAILGFIVAAVGIFWVNIPAIVGIPQQYAYLPLLFGPILYSVLWLFIVRPLNNLLGLK